MHIFQIGLKADSIHFPIGG